MEIQLSMERNSAGGCELRFAGVTLIESLEIEERLVRLLTISKQSRYLVLVADKSRARPRFSTAN
jgi:hypothetical protein